MKKAIKWFVLQVNWQVSLRLITAVSLDEKKYLTVVCELFLKSAYLLNIKMQEQLPLNSNIISMISFFEFG